MTERYPGRFKLTSVKSEVIWLFAAVFFYFAVFSFLSIRKHFSLHSTYLDLGLESQIIWNTAQGRVLETSFGPGGKPVSSLSFHISPISILLAPFYWFWPSPVVLLVLQTALLALGSVPIFLLSREIIGSPLLSLSFVVSYLLYPPLEYSNLSDFHPQTLATPLLLLTLYFLYKRRFCLFYLFSFTSLLVKENIALIIAILGIYVIFRTGEKIRGLSLLILSFIWFLFSVLLVMPYFSGGETGSLGRYEYLGKGLLPVLWTIVADPFRTLKILLMAPKIKYFFFLLVSAGFLPLFAPVYLLPTASEFLINLFSAYNPQWQIKFHYTAAITPFVFIAAVFGSRNLLSFLKRKGCGNGTVLVALYLLFISLVLNLLHSPSPLYFKFDKSVYTVTKDNAEVRRILSSLPRSSSVSAMNNLGAQLSERRFLFRFPINYRQADYVVVDPRLPQKSFDLSQVDPHLFEGYLDDLTNDRNYRLLVQRDDLIVFERR